MLEDFKNNVLNTILKPLLVSFIILVIFGMINFFSASLSVLNKNEARFYNLIENQIISYIIGFVLFFIAFYIPIKFYYKFALIITSFIIFLNLLVLVPSLSYSHAGGMRWISLFGFSMQPNEFLKISSIIIASWFIYKFKQKIQDFKFSIIGISLIIGIISIILFIQKDLGALMIITGIIAMIYFLANTKIKDNLTLITIICSLIYLYSYMNPYAIERIKNFYADDSLNALGPAYQNNQALIAIGSGGVFGKGLGQSVQKFGFLPEAVGDSIFAVMAEEWGFVGSFLVVFLFAFIIIYSINLSKKMPNQFYKSMVIGIATLFFLQSSISIASMLKIIPLSGDVLPFFSHGGTALIANLFTFGLLLQLSRYREL